MLIDHVPHGSIGLSISLSYINTPVAVVTVQFIQMFLSRLSKSQLGGSARKPHD